MLRSSHGTLTINRFITLFNGGRLNFEPAFQRKSVWTKRDRQRLIVSVFDGIPLPSVYLYERERAGLATAFDVIDGKQRLETLLLFANQGPLAGVEDPLQFRSTLDGRLDEVWRGWEDLPANLQREYRNWVIPVITVSGDLREIAELFVAINSTGKKLTGQERRHAFSDASNVLRTATKLAEDHRRFFLVNRVFTQGQMDRMLHIEFCTELLLFACDGLHHNKKRKLDEIIRGDLRQVEELRSAAAEVGQVLRILPELLPDLRATRFRQRADLYSLLTLLLRFKWDGLVVRAGQSRRNDIAGDLLRKFAVRVDEVRDRTRRAESVAGTHAPYIRYLLTVREGTDSSQQRRAREKVLDELLAGVFDAKDIQRTFNETQRRVLWHSNWTKQCAICGRQIKSFEDMHADHVEAYVRGGSTSLDNGAITHKRCNLRKGAR